jgi:tetratricopeptide (TPR) repeat protein
LDASGQGEKAITQYREAVRLSPPYALYMNDLAWALATNPNEKMRDIKEAVRLAEDACRLSGGREPRFFGTLDAAYAGAGRFEEAITTASKTREGDRRATANCKRQAARVIEPGSRNTRHSQILDGFEDCNGASGTQQPGNACLAATEQTQVLG